MFSNKLVGSKPKLTAYNCSMRSQCRICSYIIAMVKSLIKFQYFLVLPFSCTPFSSFNFKFFRNGIFRKSIFAFAFLVKEDYDFGWGLRRVCVCVCMCQKQRILCEIKKKVFFFAFSSDESYLHYTDRLLIFLCGTIFEFVEEK